MSGGGPGAGGATGPEEFRRVLRYLRPYIPRMVAAGFCMLGVAAFTGVFALLIKNVLDDVFIRGDRFMLTLIPGVILATFFLKGLFYYGQQYLMGFIGQGVIRDLRGEVYDHLQEMDLRFYQTHPTGNLVSRTLNDVNLLKETIDTSFTSLLSDSITLVTLLGVVVYRDWKLALIAFGVAPLALWPIRLFGQRMKQISRRSQETIADLTDFLTESLAGHRVIQAFTAEARARERFAAHNQLYFRKLMKKTQARAFPSPTVEMIVAVGAVAAVYYGGSRVIAGELTPGTFFSFLTALIMSYQPIRKLGNLHVGIQEGLAAAARIFQLLDEPPGICDRAGATELAPFAREVRFESVSFRYEEEWILRDVALTARAGETVAFVGPSGGGKTTLVHLLPRFYEVEEGAITLDGVDIRTLTLHSLRGQIALVGQDTFLFNTTVRDNIAYGRPAATEAEIVAAAQAANAHTFVSALPNGYDTVVGEQGVRLSGGQKQRLSIARAILKDAPILILDEATSALDTESEALGQEALTHLMVGRTTFVIAHRLSTIQQADRIYVVDGGRIVEAGSHAELLARAGLYRRLYEG